MAQCIKCGGFAGVGDSQSVTVACVAATLGGTTFASAFVSTTD
mgnify:CR=1 FL=1